MIKRKNNIQEIVNRLEYKNNEIVQENIFIRKYSFNETPVPLLDPVLKKWIKVVKPSRTSLIYERME